MKNKSKNKNLSTFCENNGNTMLSHELMKYHETRVFEIKKHLTIAAKSWSENSIHELRVEIKRLRAFYDLMNGIGLKFNLKKIFNPINRLFKKAAAIRDAQVLQLLLKELITDKALEVNISECINLLKQKEMAGQKKFLRFCNTFKLTIFKKNRDLLQKELSKIEEKKIKKMAQQYLENGLKAQRKMELKIRETPDEEKFHCIRISCKKNRYILETLSSCYSSKDFNELNNRLRSVHQVLGKWHDTDVTIIFLKGILSDKNLKPLFSKASYLKILKIVEKQKKDFSRLFFKRLNLDQLPHI